MDVNLINLLITLIALVIGIVGSYLIKYLNNKIDHDKLNYYYEITKTVVMSLEQVNPNMSGEDKKNLALAKLIELTGGKINSEDANRLIESAVYEIKKLLNKTN